MRFIRKLWAGQATDWLVSEAILPRFLSVSVTSVVLWQEGVESGMRLVERQLLITDQVGL